MSIVNDQQAPLSVAPPLELQNLLSQRTGSLRLLSPAAVEVIQTVGQADSHAQKFSRLVQRDSALNTNIISRANSFLFSFGNPVSTLDQAIVRFGLRNCRHLMIASSVTQLMDHLPLEEERVRQVLWGHSLTTAIACTCLNRSLELGFQGEEYSAGLLHDLGRLLLATTSGNQFSVVDPLDFDETADVLAREQAELGTDHCQFGAWFAYQNKIPANLVDVIRWHHARDVPPELPVEHRKLIALTAAGDHIANYLYGEAEVADYDPPTNTGILDLWSIEKGNIVKTFDSLAHNILEQVIEFAKQEPSLTSHFGGRT